MPPFSKKPAQVTIAGKYVIEVDSSDVERVASKDWRPFEITGTRRVTFIAAVEQSQRGPVMQTLASFLLDKSPSQYCEQIDASKPMDYTRKNLRIYQAPAPRHTLRNAKAKAGK
jgi:hypothetical protein